MKETIRKTTNYEEYLFWCLGCNCIHALRTNVKVRDRHLFANHIFNNDFKNPTFSLKSGEYWTSMIGSKYDCCFNITKGMITYIPSCTHRFAGESIDLKTF